MSENNPQYWNDICLNGLNMDWEKPLNGRLCYNYLLAIFNAATERLRFGAMSNNYGMRIDNGYPRYTLHAPKFSVDENDEINFYNDIGLDAVSWNNNLSFNNIRTLCDYLLRIYLSSNCLIAYGVSSFDLQYEPVANYPRLLTVTDYSYKFVEWFMNIRSDRSFYDRPIYIDTTNQEVSEINDVSYFPSYFFTSLENDYLPRFLVDNSQVVMPRLIPYADFFEQLRNIINQLSYFTINVRQSITAPQEPFYSYYINEIGSNGYANAAGGFVVYERSGNGASPEEARANIESSDWVNRSTPIDWRDNYTAPHMRIEINYYPGNPSNMQYQCDQRKMVQYFESGSYYPAYSIDYTIFLRALQKISHESTAYVKPSSFSGFSKWTYFSSVNDQDRSIEIWDDVFAEDFFSTSFDFSTYSNGYIMLLSTVSGLSFFGDYDEPDHDNNIDTCSTYSSGFIGSMTGVNGFKFR